MSGVMVIGRNDPCWCGSGKKYKKCHLSKDEAANGNTGSASAKDRMEIFVEGMRAAGAFNGQVMDYIRPYVTAGISTVELNDLVHNFTLEHGHVPACLGYRGFPKSCCISVNDVVCHGIPSETEHLKDGDIVNVDLTSIVRGYYGDSSETFLIGKVSPEAIDLVKVAAQSLLNAINVVAPGVHIKSIAREIEPFATSRGFSVVREFTGHGIGREFHESFSVNHHVGYDYDNVVLEEGMTFTIEPMINEGTWKTVTDRSDGWTARTKDGRLSAQFEHTLLVSATGVDVLTLTPSQRQAGKMLIVDGISL
jgi:methionyl aminopeptidase